MKKAFFRFYDASAHWMLRGSGYKSRFVTTDAGKMHFLERKGSGSLPPIVFIHGMSADGNEMAASFRGLRKHFRRIICVDLPGHGRSPVPDEGMNSVGMHGVLTQALDQLLDEPSFVYGNSLGGLAAIRYANHSPERVRGLFLSSPGGAGMSAAELAVFKSRLNNQTKEDVSRFCELLFEKVPAPRALIEQFVLYRFGRAPIRELFANIQAGVLLKPEEVRGLKPATLMVWGQRDALQHPQLEFFRAHLPKHAQLNEPELWSHVPHVERPKEVARMILRFANEV